MGDPTLPAKDFATDESTLDEHSETCLYRSGPLTRNIADARMRYRHMHEDAVTSSHQTADSAGAKSASEAGQLCCQNVQQTLAQLHIKELEDEITDLSVNTDLQ